MPAATAFSLARRLRAGETVYSSWCGMASPLGAEITAREGFAAVTLDQQHGLWDTAATVAAIAMVRLAGAAPIVRVPFAGHPAVSRALDFGAEGVIMPLVNSAAEARTFVAAAKYPPLGERSWGPHRATALGGFAEQKDYLREANTETVTFAMIETRAALGALDAITQTPGIDALFLGPSDLSIALSDGAALDPLSAEVERAIDRIIEAAQKAGKIAGAYCHNAVRAKALAARGMGFLAVGSDLGFLRAGIAAEIAALRG